MGAKIELNEELLLRLASATKLEYADAKRFLPQLKDILSAFSEIDSADTAGVQPSFHPVQLDPEFRDDVVVKSLSREDALANSKNTVDGYFKGPKVV